MRVLFSCAATYGHFHPLVPLAGAFADNGHEVAFATAGSLTGRVESAGFQALPAGLGQEEAGARFAPYRRRLLELPPQERRPLAFTWRFATVDAPAKVDTLRRIVATWQPDLVVHESADLAAPIVASAAGVPRAHHGFGRLVPRACFERAAEETVSLWESVGLDPEPLCGAFRGTYVDPCAPSLQSEPFPDGTPVERVRPLFPALGDETAPAWLATLPDRPIVYVTLGTVHGELEVFRLLLDALAELDCTVVMTVGRGNDPAALAPIPANAVVERYVAQSFVLPHASVVVTHGGSGSMLAALAHALPSLFVPQGADQFDNAARCAELGVGIVLMPGDITVGAVRDAVATLLEAPSYRARARALAAEIASMPDPGDVARRLIAGIAA